ncbi:hypothetical protein FHR83_003637 [Actinoplanes campanulatus]|uniref:DUF4239 domain-containing protein n=1 Tax=Actinoplanes campanulatus TaxID=113559 RepID=A0A7W5FF42_9ACTN|nr:DUF4239 domain-containing protein [Actinoplanes campanulatus]MBB3095967.1 hypothetical protein [Actinoplanes campanulatus]GGN12761.1 hypothetical protein GCM10010109_23500 [Actinoplanes campanulatus]GID36938.1 hypothetical protein Aca09nite_34440 [Actinoplanes campanulatus]
MAKWLAAEVPEWLLLILLVIGLPVFMLLLESLVHRWLPHWRRGEHNDATGIMLSAAAVVYSVAIGLCVVTLWEKRSEARAATEAEAMNLAAMAEASRVCDPAVQAAIDEVVLEYNRGVLENWSNRTHGEAAPVVGEALDSLASTIATITPHTDAERAFVLDAVRRLATATELRADAVRLAHEQQLPDVVWISVLTGSVVVLSLCVTCGVRDGWLRRVLIAGVAATIGVNVFLAVELNYPFEGRVSIRPHSYRHVVELLESRE